MRLNRKWILVMSLVLSVAMATSGTLAYLMANVSVTNTFTIGNVEVGLTEEQWTANGYNTNPPTLLPGVQIEKDPKIVNTGNTPAWVWMEIKLPTKLYTSDDVKIDWNDTYWERTSVNDADTGITTVTLKQKTPAQLAKNGETETAFNTISIPATAKDLSGLGTGEISIKVQAFAVQADDTINSLDRAIEAYNGKIFDSEGDESATNGDDDNVKLFDVPDDAYVVDSTETLLKALSLGETTILLKDGDYIWPSTDSSDGYATLARNKTLNLYGESKDAVLYMTKEGAEGADYDFDGSTVTFNGLTISSQKYSSNGNYYPGWARMEATYNDCVIDQMYVLYKGNQTFNYCTLNVSGDRYNIWTWGANNVTFDHCTFNSDGKALLVYNQSCHVQVSHCVFNDTDREDTVKAAIETGADSINDGVVKYNIEVTNTTVNGYAVNTTNCSKVTTNLWANKNGLDSEHLNVAVDGVDVY